MWGGGILLAEESFWAERREKEADAWKRGGRRDTRRTVGAKHKERREADGETRKNGEARANAETLARADAARAEARHTSKEADAPE